MKKILYSLAFASMLLCSCGGGSSSSSNAEEAPKEHILKAAQTEIKGDLKGCYELVDKNYKIKPTEYRNEILVELKRTSKDLPYDRKNVVIFPECKESSAEFCAGFGIEILDENGDVIEKQNANSNPYSWDEMTAALQLLEDETTTIAFHMEDLSKAVSFRITSLVQPNEERKTAMGSLVDAAKSAAEISDADVEDAEKAMKVAGEAMDAASKMLDALGGLK
ncbi:MAG: hypothetical protein IJ342_04050 [Muribaculaceae bacterium]|nr:hypothetical protein [Muribaculaceae bacterium]